MGRDRRQGVLALVGLQPLADAPMQDLAPSDQEAPVGDLVDERVAHREDPSVDVTFARDDQVVAHQRRERSVEIVDRLDLLQHLRAELGADDGGDLERGPRLRRQRVDARLEQLVDGLGQPAAAVRAGAVAHELLEEERVAAGPMQERRRPFLIHRPAARQRADELARIGVAKAIEVHLLVRAAGRPGIRPAGPIQREHGDREIGDQREQLVEDLDAGRIGPVQVVEDDELRAFSSPSREDGRQRLHDQPLARLGGHVGQEGAVARVRLTRQVGQHGGPAGERVVRDLAHRRAQGIAHGHPRPAVEQLGHQRGEDLVRERDGVGLRRGPDGGEAHRRRPAA